MFIQTHTVYMYIIESWIISYVVTIYVWKLSVTYISNYVNSLLKVTYRPMGPGVLSLYLLTLHLVEMQFNCINQPSPSHVFYWTFLCTSSPLTLTFWWQSTTPMTYVAKLIPGPPGKEVYHLFRLNIYWIKKKSSECLIIWHY